MAANERWKDWLRGIRRPTQQDGEDDAAWTQRMIDTRAPGTNRQCSIGWHSECSDPDGDECTCPCHWYSLESYITAIVEMEDLAAAVLDAADQVSATEGEDEAAMTAYTDALAALRKAAVQ